MFNNLRCLFEMSSGQDTLQTTFIPVMSADPYDTISVEEISPISCPDQDTSDISSVSPDQGICNLSTSCHPHL